MIIKKKLSEAAKENKMALQESENLWTSGEKVKMRQMRTENNQMRTWGKVFATQGYQQRMNTQTKPTTPINSSKNWAKEMNKQATEQEERQPINKKTMFRITNNQRNIT